MPTNILIVKVFPVIMHRCELDHKEGWALKNSFFQTVVLEKTLGSHLDSKEIKQVSPKGNQPWIFNGSTDAEAEAPVLWPPDVKSWLTGKNPDAGNDWGQEEKGATEDEMVGWHHRLNGHEFEQTPGDSEGQRSLVCYSPWGRRVRQDWVIEQQPWRVQHFLSFQLLKKRKNTLKAKYFGFLSKKRCCCC